MSRKRLFLIAAAGALLYGQVRRHTGARPGAGPGAFGPLGAAVYDLFADLLMGGFYDRVAAEVAAACPSGHLLDAGCGPGLLDMRLARIAPRLSITGIDVDPAMVERAARRAAAQGLSDRVRFEVADVAALPFAEGQFDMAVSTLSLHHWPDPARGLAELFRILKPGGQARIYDIPDWFRQRLHGWPGPGMAELATASPFGTGVVATFRWPDRVPALRCLLLRRREVGDV